MKWFGRGIAVFFVMVLFFGTALLWYLPAAFIVEQVQRYRPALLAPYQVAATQGTIWDGETQLTIQGQALALDWAFSPSGIFQGEVPLELDLQGAAIELDARLGVNWKGEAQLTADGWLDLVWLQPMLSRHRLDIPGRVSLSGLHLDANQEARWLTEAEGALDWPGGAVSFPAGRELIQADVSALSGDLDFLDGNLVLDIVEAQGQLPLLSINMGADGVSRLAVRRRLIDVVGMPWSKASEPDDVVFRVQQRLFR